MVESLGKGLLLIDYETEEYPVFRQVDNLSEVEYDQLKSAHDLLFDYIDSHVSDIVSVACGDFFDFIIDHIQRSEDEKRNISTDEHGVGLHLLLATKVMNIGNSCITYRDNRKQHAREADCVDQMNELLEELYNDCDGYRWLTETRNAMVHLDIKGPIGYRSNLSPNGMSIELTIRPSSILKVDKFRNSQRKFLRWKEELEAMDAEIQVPPLVENLGQKVFDIDRKAREILYPEETRSSAAAIVRDAIRRFDGRRGTYCFRSSGTIKGSMVGAGVGSNFSFREMDPRVLSFSDDRVYE
ncbi:hypothetical protein ACYB2S_13760 [Corynebacterium variabile]|uniref:hypothetical protein n=1 Tax=Corynebacterium variabile TaxID=1727 RepID=UPI003CBA882D